MVLTKRNLLRQAVRTTAGSSAVATGQFCYGALRLGGDSHTLALMLQA